MFHIRIKHFNYTKPIFLLKQKKWFGIHVKTELKPSSKTCTTFQHKSFGQKPRNGGIIRSFPLSQMCFLSYAFQGCVMTGCLNGGSCVNDERKQQYLCLCTKGWTGEKCKSKIGKKRLYYLLSKASVSITFQMLTMFYISVSS